MTALRPQGRPRRGLAEVGRDKIISRLVGVFRLEKDVDLSRKTLAELAGVTPALISYYFPKKEVLFEELSQPVMLSYRAGMESIVRGSLPNEMKLRHLVSLLLSMYTQDGNLLDLYATVMKKTGRSGNVAYCELTRMTEMLAEFFSTWRGRPVEANFDAAVLQGAVWGMSRFAARIDAEASTENDVSPIVARVVKLLSPSGMNAPL